MSPKRRKALELAKGLEATPKSIERVSAKSTPEAASWAFTQWELRKRARAKFERAEEMLFDRDGLEMASHEAVAKAHAEQFPIDSLIADLTCGIGSDLIALAQRSTAIGFENNPNRTEMARHNLGVHELEAEVKCEDCLSSKWDFLYAFADPSRRANGARSLDPESFLPSLKELVPRMSRLYLGLIKLSPMLSNQFLASLSGHIQFWSYKGECREAVIWVGEGYAFSFDEYGPTAAAHQVETGSTLPYGKAEEPPGEEPGAHFYEADPAAIRAGCVGSLSMLARIRQLGDSNGYLTSESSENPEWSSWLRKYFVLAFGSADEKAIKADLKKLDAKIDAVKVRGVKEDPLAWKKRLKSEGERPVVMALYPVGKSLRYVLMEPAEVPGKST